MSVIRQYESAQGRVRVEGVRVGYDSPNGTTTDWRYSTHREALDAFDQLVARLREKEEVATA